MFMCDHMGEGGHRYVHVNIKNRAISVQRAVIEFTLGILTGHP